MQLKRHEQHTARSTWTASCWWPFSVKPKCSWQMLERQMRKTVVLQNLGVPFCNHSSGTVEVPLKDEFWFESLQKYGDFFTFMIVEGVFAKSFLLSNFWSHRQVVQAVWFEVNSWIYFRQMATSLKSNGSSIAYAAYSWELTGLLPGGNLFVTNSASESV